MLNQELQSILNCLKVQPTPQQQDLDQKKLLTLVQKHRLANSLYKNITLPEESFNKINNWRLKGFKRSLQQQHAAQKLQRAFLDNNLKVLFFKGVIIQNLFYPKDDFRPAKDIDILVSELAISQAIELIKSLGYQPFSYKNALPSRLADIKKLGSIDLKHPKTKLIIELHWQLWTKKAEIPTHFKQLWQDRQQITIEQTPINTLELNLHLCYLCYHGTGHFWYRLFWLKDIQLALVSQQVNWENVLSTAQKSGILPSVLLACYLCQILFESKIPDCVQQKFNTKTFALAKTVLAVLEQNPSEQELVPKNIKQILKRLYWKWQIKSRYKLHGLLKQIF